MQPFLDIIFEIKATVLESQYFAFSHSCIPAHKQEWLIHLKVLDFEALY